MTKYDAPVSPAVLWQRWQEIETNGTENERADAGDKTLFAELNAIEKQIIEQPADNPPGLMAKLYFLSHIARDHDWNDQLEQLFSSIKESLEKSWYAGYHMSENDPFAFGGRQDDAALLDAEAEMRRLLDEGRDLEHEDDAALTRRWDRIGERTTFLNATMPKTLAGCAAKLRFLTHFEVGMATGDRDDDVQSLQQVLAFIEAELANSGAA